MLHTVRLCLERGYDTVEEASVDPILPGLIYDPCPDVPTPLSTLLPALAARVPNAALAERCRLLHQCCLLMQFCNAPDGIMLLGLRS